MKEKDEKVTPTIRIPIGAALDERRNVDKEPRPFSDLPPEMQAMLLRKKGDDEPATVISVLEGKHVMECLLYIEQMQPVMKSDIYNNVTRSEGMSRKLEQLRELGIIDVYQTARYNSNVIVLTRKGHSVCGAIRNMISIAEGTVEPYYQ